MESTTRSPFAHILRDSPRCSVQKSSIAADRNPLPFYHLKKAAPRLPRKRASTGNMAGAVAAKNAPILDRRHGDYLHGQETRGASLNREKCCSDNVLTESCQKLPILMQLRHSEYEREIRSSSVSAMINDDRVFYKTATMSAILKAGELVREHRSSPCLFWP